MTNRHERRRAAKVSEIQMIPLNQIGGNMCTWKGCEAVYKTDHNRPLDLPPGWSALLLTRSFHVGNLLDLPPGECLRDGCLCPEHTRLFDTQLKDIDRALDGPTVGSA
jgi:hypothetical protein